eukprot:GHRQ01016920.1.p2 GENE.GHRQ01016920.1~~GHRQ01016920.1.p2  ORF type:complete len:172 (+),score=31.65 GHRQ01016920.1:204-719(+)
MVTNWLVPSGESRAANGETPSASRIYRNKVAKDGFPSIEATTLHELFQNSVAKYSGEKLLGWRPIDAATGKAGSYEWLTYGEVHEKVQQVASGLAGLGIKAGDRVGVYGVNCCEWMMAMQVGVSVVGAKAVAEMAQPGDVLCEAIVEDLRRLVCLFNVHYQELLQPRDGWQ